MRSSENHLRIISQYIQSSIANISLKIMFLWFFHHNSNPMGIPFCCYKCILFPVIISEQHFAHATTAQLSCDMQNFVAITRLEFGWEMNFDHTWNVEKLFVKGAPDLCMMYSWIRYAWVYFVPGFCTRSSSRNHVADSTMTLVYRQITNISPTKSQNLNISHLVL